jgi:hypothetical protein
MGKIILIMAHPEGDKFFVYSKIEINSSTATT